jgi:hypothetical protein
METFDFFFAAVWQQALDRKRDVVPDLEAYIAQRRDTSGCKPCWALIEYANHLDLPEEVMEHDVVRALGEAANDLVTWSNVGSFLDRTQPYAHPIIHRTSSPTMSSRHAATRTI